MSLRTLLSVSMPLSRQVQCFSARSWFKFGGTTKADNLLDITSAEEKPLFVHEEDEKLRQRFDSKRNKSRLTFQHRNIVLDRKPYRKSMFVSHDTVKYKRRLLGKYGMKAIGVPAGVAWPTPEEVEDAKEYERVSFPLSLQERWDKIRTEREQRDLAIQKRDEQVAANMLKMNDWIRDLNARRTKKEKELRSAIERKEEIIAEVRRHFGFKISPHDERFKEMLLKREKDDKKKQKEAKKKAREDTLTTKMQQTIGKPEATTVEEASGESVK